MPNSHAAQAVQQSTLRQHCGNESGRGADALASTSPGEQDPVSEHIARRHKVVAGMDRLWEEDLGLLQLLEESESLEEAREMALDYLEDLESFLLEGRDDLDPLDRSVALDWARTLRGIFTQANEGIAGFSTLESLWRIAHGETDDVADDFVEEFVHALRAANGAASIGEGWFGGVPCGPRGEEDAFPRRGRRAALDRSVRLDRLGEAQRAGLARYPSGLDPTRQRSRLENRERILRRLGGRPDEWFDPSWQSAHVFRGVEGLRALREIAALSSEESAAIHLAVRHGVPWGITPYYASLFTLDSADRKWDAAIRAQVIPPVHTVRAMVEHRDDRRRSFDFMRERDTSPVDHVTRRYPSVAILKVCDVCPQVCTYCQRNWELGEAMDVRSQPSLEELDPAFAWFETHDTICDVLITGGDPLVRDDAFLRGVLDRIASVDHIRHVRIGTRVPVTMPMRVTASFANLLGRYVEPGRRTVSVVTHVECPSEVTPELVDAVARLRGRRLRVYNQQVMTLEASRRFAASATRVALTEAGVDPYYTFYTKGKEEHRDYLVPVARMLQERKEEARLLPGIFRTDEAVFNVPSLGKSHLRARQDRELIGIRADGRRVYRFHPWEKGIAPVAPWPYVDVSIADYLRRLSRLGEDIEEYGSIWYYI